MTASATATGSLLGVAHALRADPRPATASLLANGQRAMHFLARGLDWPASKTERVDRATQAALQARSWRTQRAGPIAPGALAEARELLAGYDDDAVRLVFVDGVLATELCRMATETGVTLCPLGSEQAQDIGGDALVGSLGLHTDEGLAALNGAVAAGGACVALARGARAAQPIVVSFVTTSHADSQFIAPRVLVLFGAQAEATVVERHLGDASAFAWTNAVTEIVCEEGAQAGYVIEQASPKKSYHFATVGLRIARGAHCKLSTFDAGGKLCRRSVRAELLAPSAEVSMWHVAMARGDNQASTHATMRHVAGNTSSRQVFKGVADGGGQVSFAGTVHILPQAAKVNAQQLSRGMLLSPSSKVVLRPQLMILTDDVRCQHGATVGQLDAQALFYLQSRGLSEARARELLTFAFVRDALVGVPKALQQPLVMRLARWLGVAADLATQRFDQP